ncbi:hypothetical protein F0562_024301 [Nyssa sinensis]|uniref:Uncharacterized protein n=1 Tax=Nyssa sinensis TaxID=561372 RepID=A0A5J5BEM6_9ASTE|nr:hypothetical protein F0562_024301 [Nyssa sinensis]
MIWKDRDLYTDGVVVSGLGLDSIVSSALMTAYSKVGLVDDASKSGDSEYASKFFKKMNMEGKKADPILIASLLAAAAQLVIVGPGSELHGYVLRHRYESEVMVSSTLIDIYSKCDVSTFSALLCACCHAGLGKEGQDYFTRMKDEFGIQSSVNDRGMQYTCSEETTLPREFGGMCATLPPSFTALLADCCPEAEQEPPEVLEELDLKSHIAKYMTDSSFHDADYYTSCSLISPDMLSKLERVMSALGGDLAL